MVDYKTPGVYIDEKQLLPPSIAKISTAIPAFIGYVANRAQNNALVNKPTRITTLEEYIQIFGTVPEQDKTFAVTLNADGNGIGTITQPVITTPMFFNLKFYFDNGGGACYIVAVDPDPATDVAERYEAALDTLATETEPTLLVLVQQDMTAEKYQRLVNAVLAQCQQMQDRFGIFDFVADGDDLRAQSEHFRGNITTNKDQLKYGAAYYPALNTRYGYEIDQNQITIKLDAGDKSLPQAVADGDISDGLKNTVLQQLLTYRLTLPASAAVAGLYAKVDNDRGVWKAPANVSLNNVASPLVKVTNEQNGALNIDAQTGKSINVIRDFGAQGKLIWGARTLAGNDNEWRYVPVRRLFNFVEQSIKTATAYAVFEPNDAMLWLKLNASIVSFLSELWRQGALAGAAADEAFFVEVGLGKTMTQQDILEGRCKIKIGIAAVRPAEFILLEFTHYMQQ